MSNQALKSFAEELKSLREERQISLQQIANKTRIDIKFLKAIEDGNFEVLPEIYVRAFIREYCLVVEISPAEYLNKFELAKKGKLVEDTAAETGQEKHAETSSDPKTEFDASAEIAASQAKQPDEKIQLGKKQIYAIAAALAVILLLAVYFLFFKSSTPDIITEKSYDEIMGSNQDRYQMQADSVSRITSSSSDSLQLRVGSTDTVWLKSIADNNVTKEFLLKPNSSLELRALNSFNLVIGNAGGIRLKLGNRQIDSVGKRGEVKSILLSREGMKYLPITLPPKDEQKIRKTN